MIENLICENVVQKYSYKYYLIESECKIDIAGNSKRYGMKVEAYNEDNELIDTKTIEDIFGNREKMIKGINILKKLEVTPLTLEDIIIDNIY